MATSTFNFGVKRDARNNSTRTSEVTTVPALPGLVSASVEEGSLVFNPVNDMLYVGNGLTLLPLSSGAPQDLQMTYLNSTPPDIVLDGVLGGIGIRDNAAPIAGSLFEVTDSGAATTFFSVDTSGVSIDGKLTVTGLIDPTGLVLDEQSAAPAATVPGEGQVWVRDDTPNVLIFTDDTGVDWQLTGSGATFEIVDADGDTTVSVENNPGADSDTITMTVGDNSGNYNVTPNVFSASVGGFSITTPTATGGNNDGVALDLTTGVGDGFGSGGTITLTSGNGGATNGQAGEINLFGGTGQALGAGGNISLICGNGGQGGEFAVQGGVALSAGQPGGTVSILAGAGGMGGTGGDVSILSGQANAGTGGNISISAPGGNIQPGTITISTGNNSAGSSNNINVTAGSDTSGAGLGGSVVIASGDGATPGAVSITGGDSNSATPGGLVALVGGAGDATSPGGGVTIDGGVAGATGNGGGVTIGSANGGTTSGDGGDIGISTGNAGSGPDNGGDITITAGGNSNTGVGRGGNIAINSGSGDGDGTTSGSITMTAPTGSSVGGSITGSAGDGGDTAGAITLSAGAGTGLSNDGGDVTISAGNSSNADGGSIILNPGTGSGTDGDVTVNGKLTVTGLIDPTGFVGSQQSSAPFDPSTTLTGTVSVTAGMAAVTGVGTLFTTELAVNDYINIAGEIHQVMTITDNLNLTLATNHVAGASGVSYSRLGTDGTIWVRDDVPTVLVFTDSDGVDHDISGSTASETLAETLVAGNVTGGTDIVISNGDQINTPLGGNNPLNLVVLGDPAGTAGDVNITSGSGMTPGSVNLFGGTAAAGSGNAGGAIAATAGNGEGIGDGGDLDITAGTGGVGGGLGGDVTLQGGGSTTTGGDVILNGGASATNGGGITMTGGSGLTSGGAISMTAGSSGTTGGGVTINSGGGSTAGGSITIAPGSGGATAGGMTITGGAVTNIGTSGGSVGITGGQGHSFGGAVTLTGGSSTNGGGGSVNLLGANASGVGGTGGSIIATAGSGTSTSDGGAITLSAGAGTGGATSDGGAATIRGGASTNGDGGDARINGGLGSGGVVGGFGTVIAGGSTVGGNGGDVTIDGGVSAAALLGGSITLTGGAGGSGGGAGGNTSVIGGDGQAGGAGGITTLRGGTAISGNGNGGDTFVRGGTPFGTGTGVGGSVSIIAPNGGNFGFGGAGGAGGAVSVTAGSGGGSAGASGGAITVTSGNGSTNGAGGALTLTAGNAGSGPGGGGAVNITGGGGGSGGQVNITAGNSSSLGGTGADVVITPGVGTGQDGDVILAVGGTGTSGSGRASVTSAANTDGVVIFETVSSLAETGKLLNVVRLNMPSDGTPVPRYGLQWDQGDTTSNYMWVDDSGDYRTSTSIPTNNNSGTVIGTQTSNAKYKNLGEQVTDHESARSHVIDAAESALYAFNFKDGTYNHEEYPAGVIINQAPRYGMDRDEDHPEGKVLNNIVLLADLCSCIKVLTEENQMLKDRLAAVESHLGISAKSIERGFDDFDKVDAILENIDKAPEGTYYNLKTGKYLKTKRSKNYLYLEEPPIAYPEDMEDLAKQVERRWGMGL